MNPAANGYMLRIAHRTEKSKEADRKKKGALSVIRERLIRRIMEMLSTATEDTIETIYLIAKTLTG